MKNKCSIRGCKNNCYGQGFCQKHYMTKISNPKNIQKWKSIALPGEKSCSVKGCNIYHYANGYCRKHNSLFLRNGEPITEREIFIRDNPKCSVIGCDGKTKKITRDKKSYCLFHYHRLRLGIELNREKGVKGELNPRWNGGVSEYKNHYEFKKNRIIRLDQVGWKCEKCGKKLKNGFKTHVHHKDKSKHNHSLDNLEALCSMCHSTTIINKGRPKNK